MIWFLAGFVFGFVSAALALIIGVAISRVIKEQEYK